MKKIIKWLLIILCIPLLALVVFLGYMSLTDYRPASVESLNIEGSASGTLIPDTIQLISWNIGYCGLGKEQDFFFDGGKGVRPSKPDYQRYVSGVMETIHGFAGSDFILLQEVDRDSKRSFFQDQVPMIASQLPGYAYAFALNYRSKFIPQPLSEPYGKAVAGIMSLSAYMPSSVKRHALAADASWPTGLFMLKRCFMALRFLLKNGKELVIVNLHLSAYDDGTVKQQQMDTLRKFLVNEYALGNYVIVGGDWNQFPPDYHPTLSGADGVIGMNVEKNYPESGWNWVYDVSLPTNRKLNMPYKAGKTETVVIDYFLVSPNITPLNVEVIDLGFAHSDHQPIRIQVALNR
jgi:endonuclease/exonuclease/phosphatase family metal-dependent hydrolase